MRYRTFNLAWPLVTLIGVLLITGAVFAIGAAMNVNSATNTAYPQQLGKNPAPGRVLQMPTGTDQRGAYWVDNSTGLPPGTPGQVPIVTVVSTGTATGTGYEAVDPPFVYGAGTAVGTTNYVTKKTAGGWGNSGIIDNGTDVTVDGETLTVQYNGATLVNVKGASDTVSTAPEVRFNRYRGTLASPGSVSLNDPLGYVSFYGRTNDDQIAASLSATDNGTAGAGYILGKMCMNVSDGTNNGANVPAVCATHNGVAFSVGTSVTLSAPATAGTEGQVLTRTSTPGATQWQTPTSDSLTEVVAGGGTGYLYDLIFSYTGSVSVGINSSQSPVRLNLNTTFGTSTPLANSGSGAVGTANSSSRSDHVHPVSAPAAHASTHVTGGSDVIANVVAGGNSGLMSGSDKTKLDNATATPTASRIVISDAGGKLDGWLSGKTLVASRTYLDGDFFVSSNSTWTNKVAHTFTATGTFFMVHVEAVFADGYNNGRLCGLGVMADSGSTASTLRGNGGFQAFTTADASGYNVLYSSKYINGFLSTDVYVTLAAGSVTFALAMWGATGGYTCAIPASSATMLIHEFK